MPTGYIGLVRMPFDFLDLNTVTPSDPNEELRRLTEVLDNQIHGAAACSTRTVIFIVAIKYLS